MYRSDYVVCSLLNQHISPAGKMHVLMLSASCAIGHTLSLRRKKKGIPYTNITELTADLLNALIEKVVVHEATKDTDGSRMQEVEIYYRFIGRIE